MECEGEGEREKEEGRGRERERGRIIPGSMFYKQTLSQVLNKTKMLRELCSFANHVFP